MKCLNLGKESIKTSGLYISYNKKVREENNFRDTTKIFVKL